MTIEQLTHQYIFSLRDGRWDDLRATLAEEVELVSPALGSFRGRDDVVALQERRFPGVSSLTVRRVAYAEELAFISYEIYYGGGRATVIDQLSIVGGGIHYILSLVGEWPPA